MKVMKLGCTGVILLVALVLLADRMATVPPRSPAPVVTADAPSSTRHAPRPLYVPFSDYHPATRPEAQPSAPDLGPPTSAREANERFEAAHDELNRARASGDQAAIDRAVSAYDKGRRDAEQQPKIDAANAVAARARQADADARAAGPTPAKYGAIGVGMTYEQAMAVMGYGGTEQSRAGAGEFETVVVRWANTAGDAAILVTFQNGRVFAKLKTAG